MSWRIIPEDRVIAACDTWQEAKAVWAEGRELLERLRKLDWQLEEAYKRQRRVALEVHRKQQRFQHERREGWSQEAEDRVREALDAAQEEAAEIADRVEELEDQRLETATRFSDRYATVSVGRESAPGPPPDERKIKGGIGKVPGS